MISKKTKSKRVKWLVLGILFLIFIIWSAKIGQVCSGDFEGSYNAVCNKIIK